MSFENLGLIEPLTKALKAEGYTAPTPIQQKAIPLLLKRSDVLGCAQTGTGKTAAFALPVLQLLHEDELYKKAPVGIKALVLTPTRELAIQIADSFSAYGKLLRLKHTVVFGGVSQVPQVKALRDGVDMLIATPGRLLDLINQRLVNLQHVKYFVLDEADRMLDMGFIHDVRKVIAKLPTKRQTLLFSATMPGEIRDLANSILNNPVRVEVTPVSSTAETIQQELYFVPKDEKRKLLLHTLQTKDIPSVLVFVRTKHGADRVAKFLSKEGINALAIHGDKSQGARQTALTNFKSGKTRVLIATDIAARGIDVDKLSHVINFEIPHVAETYVHRIGRTGRAGEQGVALSFCDDEEKSLMKDIQKLIKRDIKVVSHPFTKGGSSVNANGKTAQVVSLQRERQNQSEGGGRGERGYNPQHRSGHNSQNNSGHSSQNKSGQSSQTKPGHSQNKAGDTSGRPKKRRYFNPKKKSTAGNGRPGEHGRRPS
ncbi:DEAD/DEAH box helicase [Chryseolinea sp. T2]|uniref:DEAD/DEAH box helicase n=1 Tax=Chryseolinea sp. T2 TaxID=3129255 RepID=UPI0030773ECA